MFKQIFTTAIAMTGMLAIAQEPRSSGSSVPVQMVVTVDAAHGKDVPLLQREDVMVFQGKDRLRVTDWTALKGEQAGLELFVLIDDASAGSLGIQLADLREFIGAQPAATSIGIGYMHNGSAEIAQTPTSDHGKAAKALRLPFGRIAEGASPYLALEDLIKKWPSASARREVLLISSGVDPLGGFGPTNPYLDTAIGHAQRAGIIVYAIYTPRAGHGGHSFWQMSWGQNHLAQLSEETGGESYMLGFGAPVALAPYLREVAENLTRQYSVSFLAKPPAKPGFVPVRFSSEVPNAEIIAAPKVYVAPERPPSGDER